MNHRSNGSQGVLLILVILIFLMAIVGVGLFGLIQYRRSMTQRERAIRAEMMARGAAEEAEEQVRALEAANKQLENFRKEDEPSIR